MKRTRKEPEKPESPFIERSIVIGLITSTEYIRQIRDVYQTKFLSSPMAKRIATWCIDYYDTYKTAIGKNIEPLYFEKLKEGKLPPDVAEEIEQDILPGLSSEYEREGIDQYLVDSTIRHFEERNHQLLIEKLQAATEAGEVDTFKTLIADFKPIQSNTLTSTQGYNAWELFNMEIKPTEWLIRDLIPKGLTIFGGQSKLGKSYLMLNMVLRLAQKKPIFSDDPETGYYGAMGKILYLALEDPQSRLKQRLLEIEPEPNINIQKIRFEHTWRPLSKGGLTDLELWIKSEKNPKLIVIDVVAKVWDMRSTTGGGRQYSEEYNIFGPLADLAHKYKLSIIAVTHTKKTPEKDVFNEILGGSGTYGSADNLMVLTRTPNNQRQLSIRGKDIDEKHLLFEVSNGAQWNCLGEAEEVQKTEERQSLYNYLMQSGPKKRSEIEQAAKNGLIDIKVSSIPVVIRKMVNDGKIIQHELYGEYSAEGQSNLLVGDKMKRKNINNG